MSHEKNLKKSIDGLGILAKASIPPAVMECVLNMAIELDNLKKEKEEWKILFKTQNK